MTTHRNRSSYPTSAGERAEDRSPTVHARVEVILRGSLPQRAKQYAADKVAVLVQLSPLPILHARVKLIRTQHRAVDEHVVAEVTLDVNGRPVRAHVAAASSHEAVDLAQDRLRRKLSQLGRHPAWHGGRERSHRPGYARQPITEREVVRHKTFEPASATPDDAVFDMEMMDYDFQLFTDAKSGVDSVVYRTGRQGYRLARLVTTERDDPGATAEVTVDSWPAPQLTLAAAIGALDTADVPFVFFADADAGRGNVLYQRHDGNYGLITPSE